MRSDGKLRRLLRRVRRNARPDLILSNVAAEDSGADATHLALSFSFYRLHS